MKFVQPESREALFEIIQWYLLFRGNSRSSPIRAHIFQPGNVDSFLAVLLKLWGDENSNNKIAMEHWNRIRRLYLHFELRRRHRSMGKDFHLFLLFARSSVIETVNLKSLLCIWYTNALVYRFNKHWSYRNFHL